MSRPASTCVQMEEYLLNLNEQILAGYNLGRRFQLPPSYKKASGILFCGFGGSGISAEIIRALSLRSSRLPILCYRAGAFPQWVNRTTLVILSSYSGNTEEVLEALKEAIRARAKILVLSSGGKLAEAARQKKIPVLRIPSGVPPRAAIGYLTFSLIPVLGKMISLSVTPRDVRETLSLIRKARTQARPLTRKFVGRFLHLYSLSPLTEPVTKRWRTQLAENAKTLSSHYPIPEFFHNEIEGWRFKNKNRSAAVFFLDRNDLPVFRKKARLAEKAIRRSGTPVVEIKSEGRSALARLFYLMALGDWVSLELASAQKIDPMSITLIDALKKIR